MRGLLTVVPNIGRELPVISDLFPNHNILPGHFLRSRGLGLQAEGSDLASARLLCASAFVTDTRSANRALHVSVTHGRDNLRRLPKDKLDR
jgi:hypothetical protein